jgi:hypothetical protein
VSVFGGAAVSVVVGAVCVGGVAAVSVLLFIGGFVDVAVTGGRGRLGRGVLPESGNVPAIVPGCPDVEVVVAVPGTVKAVVVSTLVSVTAEVVGGGVSPGALRVEVTPSADPSWTTSYCC